MDRYSPGERSSDHTKEMCLIRAHSLISVAINLLMDARKELSAYGNMPELGREAYRVAKNIEWLENEIENTRRLISQNKSLENK